MYLYHIGTIGFGGRYYWTENQATQHLTMAWLSFARIRCSMRMDHPPTPRSRKNRSLDRAIGRQLRDTRLSCGVSQEELAQRLGVDRVSLSRYETGERAIPFSAILTISLLLQRPLSDFQPLEQAAGTVPDRVDADVAPLQVLQQIVRTLEQNPQLAEPVHQFLAALQRDDPSTGV